MTEYAPDSSDGDDMLTIVTDTQSGNILHNLQIPAVILNMC